MKSVGLVIKEMQRPWSRVFMGWGVFWCIIPKAVAAAVWLCTEHGAGLCVGLLLQRGASCWHGGGLISPASRERGDEGQQSAEEWVLPIQPC